MDKLEAEYIKKLRKSGCTWRRIAEIITGDDNQLDGRELVLEAENVLNERFDQEYED